MSLGLKWRRIGARVWRIAPLVITLVLTLIGLGLRVEHAMTFDGATRGSDYGVYVQGVRWMMEHQRPFDFDPTVHYQVRYQPPVWFALSAVVLFLTDAERAIAGISVFGWLVRQLVLARFLKDLAPASPWARATALAVHALLPLGILIDGKVNPEGLHATLFTLALYTLWRMERQVRDGISPYLAGLFGLLAGLAILTKGTSSTLVIGAAIVFVLRMIWMRAEGLGAIFSKLVRPGLVAAGICYLTIGWYCLPNYRTYGHPFPHVWDIEGPEQHPELKVPTPYRRPLGWALPLEWQPYLDFPFITSPWEPRPNFWSTVTVGTWADIYNRGFCRLKGKRYTEKVWGGKQGFMSRNRNWKVSLRCVNQEKGIARYGLPLTLMSVVGVAHTAYVHLRRRGRRSTLVVPLAAILGAFFVGLFSLAYPFDNYAVLNPRYLMPISVPMIACFGAWISQIRGSYRRTAMLAVAWFCILGVGGLIAFMRFGH